MKSYSSREVKKKDFPIGTLKSIEKQAGVKFV